MGLCRAGGGGGGGGGEGGEEGVGAHGNGWGIKILRFVTGIVINNKPIYDIGLLIALGFSHLNNKKK